MKPIAIIILSNSAFAIADKIKSQLKNATIYGFEKRVTCCDTSFSSFSQLVQKLYKQDVALITCCATGIIIRALSPLLQDKYGEPPVICISEDGKLIVPLLGAANGGNRLANEIASITDGFCAITSNGERRLGINLLDPPDGLKLINPHYAKSFISQIINGETVRLIGNHAWLDSASLPLDEASSLSIEFIDHDEVIEVKQKTLTYQKTRSNNQLAKAQLPKGKVSIIGLGPGDKNYLTPSAQKALDEADDILGYDFYIKLAAPFKPQQTIHQSDNRRELERAKYAIELAAGGRKAAIVSSGDPGVFAMAAAVFEMLDTIIKTGIETGIEAGQDHMPDIDIIVEPGITSAFAGAAKMGAPLGHDFAIISLSDNLKPFEIIAKRLKSCCEADMALALYNPVSKARPEQIIKALDIIKTIRKSDTPIGLGHDISRPTENLKITTLGAVDIDDITSRTIVIIGSSKSKIICANDKKWFYTPRSYLSDD
ncbi:precorrin-3B C(17)-methyltransferase [Bartonella sp. HY329]|uniref:precorrin-3B C(17)-methyltransferase n=1 Tax=unclassified Bartonella TaxID=2645622 RepID=UPI0021C703D1|nr:MULTISPECIES: precorrin-3B C(17)-methyltransferase [unclassified Bartonella]UXM96211.1 precorrin-3B C(17)-methyltransferase [Bartonella sp. HY329]UXN10535.1 precorrin-3B C(17)-methyltransferase [Bartonella sp. HY328]